MCHHMHNMARYDMNFKKSDPTLYSDTNKRTMDFYKKLGFNCVIFAYYMLYVRFAFSNSPTKPFFTLVSLCVFMSHFR